MIFFCTWCTLLHLVAREGVAIAPRLTEGGSTLLLNPSVLRPPLLIAGRGGFFTDFSFIAKEAE